MRCADRRRRHHGSLITDRLTRQGLDVVIIEREMPGRGSTAANTSTLLWETDRSLGQPEHQLRKRAGLPGEFGWAGTFDASSDGLPLIGPVPGAKGIFAAYGYGGNGITFSFLAAQLIADLIAGSTSPLPDGRSTVD